MLLLYNLVQLVKHNIRYNVCIAMCVDVKRYYT